MLWRPLPDPPDHSRLRGRSGPRQPLQPGMRVRVSDPSSTNCGRAGLVQEVTADGEVTLQFEDDGRLRIYPPHHLRRTLRALFAGGLPQPTRPPSSLCPRRSPFPPPRGPSQPSGVPNRRKLRTKSSSSWSCPTRSECGRYQGSLNGVLRVCDAIDSRKHAWCL